jgi:hypothetical protein
MLAEAETVKLSEGAIVLSCVIAYFLIGCFVAIFNLFQLKFVHKYSKGLFRERFWEDTLTYLFGWPLAVISGIITFISYLGKEIATYLFYGKDE